MPPRQPPDLAATIARMEGRLAELERTVRRGKAAPKIRDLGDADMTKATDGQVPTYDAATGKYKPGGGFSYIRVGRSGAAQSVSNNIVTQVEFDFVDYREGTELSWSSSQPSQVSTASSGYFHVDVEVTFAEGGGGYRRLSTKLGAGADDVVDYRNPVTAAGFTPLGVHTSAPAIVAGTVFYSTVLQNSGAARNLVTVWMNVWKIA